MLKVYKTHHVCDKNEVSEHRYWIANDENSKLIHIGVCDIDKSWISMLVENLGAKFIELNIPGQAFKELMISEGYEQ